jgi:hypothetical protein
MGAASCWRSMPIAGWIGRGSDGGDTDLQAPTGRPVPFIAGIHFATPNRSLQQALAGDALLPRQAAGSRPPGLAVGPVTRPAIAGGAEASASEIAAGSIGAGFRLCAMFRQELLASKRFPAWRRSKKNGGAKAPPLQSKLVAEISPGGGSRPPAGRTRRADRTARASTRSMPTG